MLNDKVKIDGKVDVMLNSTINTFCKLSKLVLYFNSGVITGDKREFPSSKSSLLHYYSLPDQVKVDRMNFYLFLSHWHIVGKNNP